MAGKLGVFGKIGWFLKKSRNFWLYLDAGDLQR